MKSRILTLLLVAALATSETATTRALKLSGEPPAPSVNKGDVEDKSDKEKEEQAKEIE